MRRLRPLCDFLGSPGSCFFSSPDLGADEASVSDSPETHSSNTQYHRLIRWIIVGLLLNAWAFRDTHDGEVHACCLCVVELGSPAQGPEDSRAVRLYLGTARVLHLFIFHCKRMQERMRPHPS